MLLEPHYWRHRLQEQRQVRKFLLRVPRPDLSSAGCEVEELRFRAHDGVTLRGLIGRCPLFHDKQPARLHTVGACDLPVIDPTSVQTGLTEIVLQLPAGRRLEDRVLDVLRGCDLAQNLECVDMNRVELAASEQGQLPDEVRIAEQLRTAGIFE